MLVLAQQEPNRFLELVKVFHRLVGLGSHKNPELVLHKIAQQEPHRCLEQVQVLHRLAEQLQVLVEQGLHMKVLHKCLVLVLVHYT